MGTQNETNALIFILQLRRDTCVVFITQLYLFCCFGGRYLSFVCSRYISAPKLCIEAPVESSFLLMKARWFAQPHQMHGDSMGFKSDVFCNSPFYPCRCNDLAQTRIGRRNSSSSCPNPAPSLQSTCTTTSRTLNAQRRERAFTRARESLG